MPEATFRMSRPRVLKGTGAVFLFGFGKAAQDRRHSPASHIASGAGAARWTELWTRSLGSRPISRRARSRNALPQPFHVPTEGAPASVG